MVNNKKTATKKARKMMRKMTISDKSSQKNKQASTTSIGKLLRSIGSAAGTGLGTLLGGPAGSVAGGSIGQEAGALVSKIFGQGAYEIQQNSLLNSIDAGVPVMHSASESITFRHREYIADVSSSTSFVTTTYSINPGLPTTFPFLSAIAQNFQEYDFKGLVFEFKSTSADALNSTNTALGTIILAAQYRADAPAFTDKQQMLNEMWSIDGKPSECRLLPIECAPIENPFNVQYVRTGTITTGDIKMYDLGNLVVGSYGSQASAVVGELWATYEVVLRKPQLSTGLDLNGDLAQYTATSYGNFFGATPVALVDTIGLTFSNTNSTLNFPVGTQGKYLFYIQWVGTQTSGAWTAPSISYTNCSAVSSHVSPSSTVDKATNCDMEIVVNVTDPTLLASMALSSGTLPSSITNVYLLVTQINNSAR